MADAIRIELGAETSPGVWEYHSIAYPSVCGRSRQPLLDALAVGAAYTVGEPAKGGAPKFQKYQPFDFSGLRSEREAV